MNFRRFLVPLGLAVLFVAAYRAYGWQGVITVSGGVVMWLLLHYTRLMNVLKKARNRPIGFVGSAVMLNARLKPGVTLMHVIAMTQALGELRTPQDTQPEVYRWTDASQSYVEAEFRNGRLVRWELQRPEQRPEVTSGETAAS
ncbi:MAG: glycerate kinase [Acidovorax sp.]